MRNQEPVAGQCRTLAVYSGERGQQLQSSWVVIQLGLFSKAFFS